MNETLSHPSLTCGLPGLLEDHLLGSREDKYLSFSSEVFSFHVVMTSGSFLSTTHLHISHVPT